jgi:hypothetical protein
MTAFVCCAATCLLVASLPAQNQPSPTVQKLLPPDAKIIETANLRLGPRKARALVLWMEHAERVVRQDAGYCGDNVYGDYWMGPTRLSLFDLATSTLVNTIEIRSSYELQDDKEHVFQIPFLVSDYFYSVPTLNANEEGQPTILNLQDLTGEGIAGQFVLFDYTACGIVSTSVFGYSPESERAMQYPIEIVADDRKVRIERWAWQIFASKPIRPGYWDFTWEPGYGADVFNREQDSFDKARQLFVDKRTMSAYPVTALPK